MIKEPGKRWNHNQWVSLAIISTAYIAVFANIQGFKAMLPLVQDEFMISRAQVGLYSSFYFLSAVLIAIFSGRIADFLGTKRGLVLGVGVVGLMMILHSVSPFFGMILALAFITGIAFSLITPSVNKGVIEHSEPSNRGLSMGIVHGGGGLGGFLGAVMLPFFGEIVGWRTALLFGSLFAVLVAFFISRLYRPAINPDEDEEENDPDFRPARSGSLKEELNAFLQDRYLLSVFAMGMVFGMSISSVTGHFPLYLTRDLGTTAAFAGLGLGVFHIGGIGGQPIWGLINEKVFHGDRRKGLALLGLLISVLMFFFGFIVSSYYFPPFALLIFSLFLGFCIMGVIAIYFTAVSELVPKAAVGVATGLALIFPRGSTVITPPLFGLAADISGTYALSWVLLGIIVLALSTAFYFFSGRYYRPSSG